MQVRIYKSIRNPMQSVNNKEAWILEFKGKEKERFLEGLMNRTSSKNMSNEIRIEFSNLEEAVRFAEKNNYIYEVMPLKEYKVIKKSYASNFK